MASRGTAVKTIITNLSERRFLERIDSLCTKEQHFDNGYADSDVFVVRRKHAHFRIGRHMASRLHSRTDFYLPEFLIGEYSVNSQGKVELKYRFGKPLSFIIPDILVCLVVLPMFIVILYQAVFYADWQWGGMLVTMFLSFVGLFGLFVRSKKTRTILEEHLRKICFPKK